MPKHVIDTVLFLSPLMHKVKIYWFSMKYTYSLLECVVGQLTISLKCNFLDKNFQFLHRNTMGPWNKVSQISMYVFLTMNMTNYISFMSMVVSLRLWLCITVLDYNFISSWSWSCYVYHFCVFQNTFSLHIISLVLLGHNLSDKDLQMYLVFVTILQLVSWRVTSKDIIETRDIVM